MLVWTLGSTLALGSDLPARDDDYLVDVAGWSADGSAFLYRIGETRRETSDEVAESVTIGVKLDRTGARTEHLVEYAAGPDSTGELKRKYAGLEPPGEWNRLASTAVPCLRTQRGLELRVTAREAAVKIRSVSGQVRATLAGVNSDLGRPEAEREPVVATITASLVRGGVSWPVFHDSWIGPGWARTGESYLDACFAPDGRSLALVSVIEAQSNMRGGVPPRVVAKVVPTGVPVQVLAPPEFPEPRRDAIAATLPAGFAPVFVGPAQKQRDRSIVYAGPGTEALALALVAELPGGASLEPLTWDASGALVVVALGASAASP